QAPQRPRQFRFDENVEIAQVGAQEDLRGPQEQIQPPDQLQEQLAQQDMPRPPRNTDIQCFSVTPDKLQDVADELRLRYKNRRDVSINPNKRLSQIFVTAPVPVLNDVAEFL